MKRYELRDEIPATAKARPLSRWTGHGITKEHYDEMGYFKDAEKVPGIYMQKKRGSRLRVPVGAIFEAYGA